MLPEQRQDFIATGGLVNLRESFAPEYKFDHGANHRMIFHCTESITAYSKYRYYSDKYPINIGINLHKVDRCCPLLNIANWGHRGHN
jgi:hypothetical protein